MKKQKQSKIKIVIENTKKYKIKIHKIDITYEKLAIRAKITFLKISEINIY